MYITAKGLGWVSAGRVLIGIGNEQVSGTINRSNHDQHTCEKQTWLAAGPAGDIQERIVLAAKTQECCTLVRFAISADEST